MGTYDDDRTYNDLFIRFPEESSASISAAYQAIEQILSDADSYFQVSLSFGFFAEIDCSVLIFRLG